MLQPPASFHHFRSLGFHLRTQIDFEGLLKLVFEKGESFPFSGGKYLLWESGEGIQLWVKIKDRAVLCCVPHYRGEGRLNAAVEGFYSRPEEMLVADGALRGTSLPSDSSDAGSPLVLDVPGFEDATSRAADSPATAVQIAAFAHHMHCFSSAEVFARHQEDGAEIGSFIFLDPPLTAVSLSGPVPAEARIAARVLQAELRVNPITHQNFIALVAETLGGNTIDIVASPQTASGELVVGGIVQGTFWLSGRVLEAASGPSPRERAPRRKSPVLSRLTGWVRDRA